jgi:hypothetical protein
VSLELRCFTLEQLIVGDKVTERDIFSSRLNFFSTKVLCQQTNTFFDGKGDKYPTILSLAVSALSLLKNNFALHSLLCRLL